MFTKIWVILLCLCFSLYPQVIHAQTISNNIPLLSLAHGEQDVGDALSPLRMGQRAPFTGVLVSNHATARLLVDRLALEETCQIEIRHQLDLTRAESQLSIDGLQVHIQELTVQNQTETAARDERIANLTTSLRAAQGNPVSSFTSVLHSVMYISTGLVVGALAGFLIGVLIK